jgi:phosphoglycerate dehydrogenase-like enzyme
MEVSHVVFAGPQFPSAREQLAIALPDLEISYRPVSDLGSATIHADVLVPLIARVDAAYMERVEGLRLIQQWGAGLEGVDVTAATARNIAVGNVDSSASGNADSVAEWCVMAALAQARRLTALRERIRSGGDWGDPPGRTLSGKTAGIVGLGGIGVALARRLSVFDMDVIAVTRHPTPARTQALALGSLGGLEWLPELLRKSDFVFLCLPLNHDTARIINSESIQLMRRDSCLINAGRGGLVDEQVLLQALEDGTIASAAMDVYEREPVDLGNPLISHPAVLATPHIAGVTDSSYSGIAKHVARIIRTLMADHPLEHCKNWLEVSERFYEPISEGDGGAI